MQKTVKKSLIITLMLIMVLGMVSYINPGSVMAAQESKTKSIQEKVTETNIFADIAEKVDDGVVKVTSYVEVDRRQQMSPFFNDPFFKYFFGDELPTPRQQPEQQEPETQKGFGSGFIVSKDGYIVTNQHVINEAKKVEVEINGFEEPLSAKIAWSDYSLDLAVLKVNTGKNLSPIKLGDSENIRPGEWAVAIGNPYGFEHTVTVGVISALGRPIQIPASDNQVRTYRNLIQLDAAINPGNSGGPLLNIDGEVIGINTAVSSQGQGIGFAIPVNEVKDIVEQLKTKGEVKRPWLGVYFRGVNKEIKEYFNLKNTDGVLIVDVVEDSPAAEAGLKPYDVIKEVDRKSLKDIDQLKKIIENKEVGERVLFKVIRNGNSQVIFARIGKKPNRSIR